MPQERENQYPNVTAEEFERIRAETNDPARVAARVIVTRHITGIPRRPYLVGDNDHAPVMQAVREFAGAVVDLLANNTPETRKRVRDLMEKPDGL